MAASLKGETEPKTEKYKWWETHPSAIIVLPLVLVFLNWEKIEPSVEPWLLGFANLAGFTVGGLKMFFSVFWPTFVLVGGLAFLAGYFTGRKK